MSNIIHLMFAKKNFGTRFYSLNNMNLVLEQIA